MPVSALSRDEIFSALQTGENGLDPGEVRERLARFGFNEIETRRRKNYLRLYLAQYIRFFAVLLEVAAALSFIANFYAPGEGFHLLGYAILGAVVINASFAFWQEYKADRTVEALRKLVPSLVRVRRSGEPEKIPAREIVPGDILLLEEGDRIAADAVLVGDNSLYINTATLTGESVPARRQAGPVGEIDPLACPNLVFAGTTVAQGNGVAVVTTIGKETEFGKIAALATETRKRLTPMQHEIIRITRLLTIAALIVGGVFFVLGYVFGKGLLIAAIFALSLIVANVPEGMLPTITLSLSLASQNMAGRNALIKNLDSVQTLGSATVILTDKTGTITRNEMTLKEIFLSSGELITISGEGYGGPGEAAIGNGNDGSSQRLDFFLAAGSLNCRATIHEGSCYGDPTELALVAAALKLKVVPEGYTLAAEFPFSSDRQMMSTVYRKGDTAYLFSKGAPEVILPLCSGYLDESGQVRPLVTEDRERFFGRAEEFERKAYRVLAVAYRKGEDEHDLIFLGLAALMDLPRAEVYDAILQCRKAGIRVIICTGDNPLTAKAIAAQIGLPVDSCFTGDEVASMPDPELSRVLADSNILFARVQSRQKMRIAGLLQDAGEVVAMTGDGVNDAPALKKADIGIAMGIRGTEVAKEAADMILIDDNFASIVAAIEEGRAVYFNIKKFVTYILSSNIPEIVPYILQFFLRIPLPLTVIQILSIDLGSDMVPGLALGSERPEKDVMNRPPVGRDERILDREVFKRGYFFLGIIEGTAAMTAFLGFLFLSGWQYGDLSITGSELHLQAMTMTLLGAISCQLANVYTLRSWEFSSLRKGFFTNRLLIAAYVLEFIWIIALLTLPPIQLVFNTAAVPPVFLLLLVPFPILLFVSHEAYKRHLRKKEARKKEGLD
ncbi:MAG: cation-transporting P-type ATPase [Methanomicrobiales archaeon]|nr:cation-transporting P-type ATPase [Methanomicrobiales archaeon]